MQHQPGALEIKSSAIRYFNDHSKLWADRYSDPGSGELLWGRHRTILELVDEWRLPAEAKIVDIGCGAGFLTFDLARRGLGGVGIDGAFAMIQSCLAGQQEAGLAGLWEYRQADVEQIPFPDHSFDVAICCGVIEYVPADDGLLREVKRILRPGGHFILGATNKYGYSACLNPVFQRLKRIPGMIRFATATREFLTGRDSEMMNLPFIARRHRPGELRRSLSDHGFQFEKDRYAEFTLVPGPLHLLLSKLERRVEPTLKKLDRTPLRVFGSSYIVSSRSDSGERSY